MTGKATLAGLDLGGGKAVIMGNHELIRTEALLKAFGRRSRTWAGGYITAEDVGTSEADMDVIGRVTGWVVGRSPEHGGAGDPSPATALGVFEAMRATVSHTTGSDDLAGVRVTVVGVGKVGRPLVERLVAAGAVVSVADLDDAAVAGLVHRLGVEPVAPADALTNPCDVLAPCALGGVLNVSTIPPSGARWWSALPTTSWVRTPMPSGWPTWASSTPRTSWSTPVGSSMWPTSCTATTMSASPRGCVASAGRPPGCSKKPRSTA